MNRRHFIAATLGFGAFGLPGCATTMTRPVGARPACLPRVNVAPDRLIRSVAGLRPYRASSFVVRAEALGGKRLVHNYGHGGAGITLSWGSSRLATLLGLQGHQGDVAVIGAGVMGLTTARLVQEAGFPVTIYTKALTPDTTSNIAGGQIAPFGHYDHSVVTPEWRAQFMAAMDYSWRRFQIMVGEDYGIRWLPTFEAVGPDDAPSPMDTYLPGVRRLERNEHPFPFERTIGFNTMYVEVGRFLRELTRDVQIAGGTIRVREFATPAELVQLRERLIFNCTGLGSYSLFGDHELTPVRGQLAILLPQPEIRYAYAGPAGYMFPRADGILLGGTFERGEWEAAPVATEISRIIEAHRALAAEFRCSA